MLPRIRGPLALGCLLALTMFSVSGCDVLETIFAPCNMPKKDGRYTDPDLLDGIWSLELIDGKAIPAGGYKIPGTDPLKPSEFLRQGNMILVTTNAYHGQDCGKVQESRGLIKFLYMVSKGTDPVGNIKQYAGRFHRDNVDNTASIGADKYTLPVQLGSAQYLRFVSTRSSKTLTVTATIGFGPVGLTYVLFFVRGPD